MDDTVIVATTRDAMWDTLQWLRNESAQIWMKINGLRSKYFHIKQENTSPFDFIESPSSTPCSTCTLARLSRRPLWRFAQTSPMLKQDFLGLWLRSTPDRRISSGGWRLGQTSKVPILILCCPWKLRADHQAASCSATRFFWHGPWSFSKMMLWMVWCF